MRTVTAGGCLLFVLMASMITIEVGLSKTRITIDGLSKQEGMRQIDTKVGRRLEFRIPPQDQPRTVGGATRANADCQPTAQVPFIPVVPTTTSVNLTTSGRPTFFWATGYKQPMEIVVVEEATQAIVWNQVVLAPQPGIVSVRLPAHGPELVPDKEYGWYVMVQCDPRQLAANPIIYSYIKRVQPASDLSRQLQKASLQQHPAIYAAAGIWFETLTSLTELRRIQPQNQEYSEDWRSLLESVKLHKIVQQPLVEAILPKPAIPPKSAAPSKPQPAAKPQGSRYPELRPAGVPAPASGDGNR